MGCYSTCCLDLFQTMLLFCWNFFFRGGRGPSPFRFENMWLEEEDFKEFVKS